MKINILHLVEGARKASGCVVIIDVFNAFTVETYIMNNGAKNIIPIADENDAYKLKEKDNNLILVGERHGEILPGFDYGNSPSEIKNVDFSNKIVIHTTSAGTQGISNAVNAEEILTGSLVNASAIANYIKLRGFKEVSLVCMGFETKVQTSEDNLCARYIKDLLENKNTGYMEKEIEKLKTTSKINFFDEKQQHIFPQEDFYLSTELNKFDFVLRVKKDKIMNSVEKITFK